MNLARFRNVSGLIDPERQATVQLQMISKLQDELIASRNELMQLRAFAPPIRKCLSCAPRLPAWNGTSKRNSTRLQAAPGRCPLPRLSSKIPAGLRSRRQAARRSYRGPAGGAERSPPEAGLCRADRPTQQPGFCRRTSPPARYLRDVHLRPHCVRDRVHADGRHPRASRLIMDCPASNGSLQRSLVIQIRVIWALILREILTRYGRHNIGFLWLFVEPMLFTLGITALWTVAGLHHGSDLPIIAFALTGYSTVLLWRNMPNRCVNAVMPNSALMYHRNVRVIDIFLSRITLEAIGATISFVSLSFLFISLEWMSPPEDALKVLHAWLLTAWFGAAFAMLLGALSERTEIVDKLWHPAAYLLFPLSGAAFLVMHCQRTSRMLFFGFRWFTAPRWSATDTSGARSSPTTTLCTSSPATWF